MRRSVDWVTIVQATFFSASQLTDPSLFNTLPVLDGQHIFHIRTKPANARTGGVRGCAGAGVRLILILCGYIFNMDMPRMDQLAMMVDASFGELYSVSVPWYASSGPHTAKLMIHHIDPNSDLLSFPEKSS